MVDFNQQFDYLDTLVDKPKVEPCNNHVVLLKLRIMLWMIL